MKKVACFLLVMCALISVISVSYGEGGYLWMVDAGSGVNVRDAKKNGNVVGFLRRGEIIKVVEEDSRWVGFYMDNGNIGYVYKQYLLTLKKLKSGNARKNSVLSWKTKMPI